MFEIYNVSAYFMLMCVPVSEKSFTFIVTYILSVPFTLSQK